jgi:hypothetical protein
MKIMNQLSNFIYFGPEIDAILCSNYLVYKLEI